MLNDVIISVTVFHKNTRVCKTARSGDIIIALKTTRTFQ